MTAQFQTVLKGRHQSAQGETLYVESSIISQALKGRNKSAGIFRPFRALYNLRRLGVGLCPTFTYFALSGLVQFIKITQQSSPLVPLQRGRFVYAGLKPCASVNRAFFSQKRWVSTHRVVVKSLNLFFCFFLLISSAQAQINPQTAINTLAKDADLKHAGLGFCVIDVEANKVVAQHNADLGLITASSLKAVTTATALGILGGDFRYETKLEYDGKITSDGTLQGNLYITGQGDPTLGSQEMEGVTGFEDLMEQLSKAVRKAGIQCIDGYVVGDAGYFETAATGRTWIWEDMGNYYAGGTHGLNIHENLYYIDFRLSPNLSKDPTVKNVRPEVPGIEFANELNSAGAKSGDNAYIFGAPYTNMRYIRGTLPIGKKDYTIKGSLPEPALFAAHHLAKTLNQNSIHNEGKTATQRQLQLVGHSSSKRQTIYTIKSPPLKDIVRRANMKSVNLYCESLLKTIGKKQSGKGTNEAGLEAIKAYWTTRGVDMSGFVMRDGSGLSPRNSISTRHLATIMRKVAKDKAVFKDLHASLPVAAESGGLQNMFKGTKAAGNLRAKSGYMEGVRSYTGFAKSKSGKLLSFSIIANNYKGSPGAMRKKMEKVMAVIAEVE